MTSYPSTELPLCGESNRKPKTPPPSSKYLLFLSLVSGCKNILPVQETSKILPPLTTRRYYKEVLLGGYRYDRDHRCSLVRRGEFLHQLYMLKVYVYVPRG